MKWLIIAIFVCFALYIVATVFVRFAPIDLAYYDRAPEDLPDDGKPHQYARLNDDAPVFEIKAEALASVANEVMLARARTERIGGSPQDLRMSYRERTKLMGYPDFILISVSPLDDEHARLDILSRSHYGREDFGTNQARVENIIDDISLKLAQN